MGPKKCEVCKEADSKYKCPSCLTPYCSLICYKKHKEIPCGKTESSPPPLKPNEEDSVAAATAAVVLEEASDPLSLAAAAAVERQSLIVRNPGDVLQQLQLESIASCSEIREALINDETLQKIILQIDSSSEAEIELTNSMEEVEAFYKFTEKIRSIISPQ